MGSSCHACYNERNNESEIILSLYVPDSLKAHAFPVSYPDSDSDIDPPSYLRLPSLSNSNSIKTTPRGADFFFDLPTNDHSPHKTVRS